MLTIGCHLSSSKGFMAMAEEAKKIGANTFQFFTRNPRGGKAKELDLTDLNKFLEISDQYGIKRIMAHAPYTLNACAADPKIREFAKEMMCDDLKRMERLPGNYYNFHPGSHVKQGADIGIVYISDMLNELLKPEQTTTVLLETMAGKGSEIGANFNELKKIIELTQLKDHIGVCLDTCHLWEAGYDIVNHLDDVLDLFDQVIGLDRLKAVHLNDSKNELGAKKDRHEKIGEGKIGKEALIDIINHPVLRELPFYLETPNELDGYAKEIQMLKGAYQ